MRQSAYKVPRAFGLLVAALSVAGCGTASSPVANQNPLNPGAATSAIATGPVLGAWWDTGIAGLRTVYGVPGAAYQGQPTFNNGTWSGAAVCMRQQIALLTTSGGALYQADVPQGQPALVASLGPPRAQVVFSPSCNVALAWAPGNSSALVVQSLLSTPQVSSVSLPASASAAAVADSGSILISARQADGAAAVQFLAAGSSSFRPVLTLSKLGGMAFLPGTDTALLADQAAGTVVEASQMSAGLSITHIAGPRDGVAQPVALAVSADGHTAAVANQTGSTVVRIDLTGQSPAVPTICPCSPTELQPLAGNLLFRVNDAAAGTVWAWDGDAPTPRFVFLPSPPLITASSQGARP